MGFLPMLETTRNIPQGGGVVNGIFGNNGNFTIYYIFRTIDNSNDGNDTTSS